MTTCPVCEKEYTSHICPVCRFDDSCNYEAYPTLQALSIPVMAVCGRKEALAHRHADFVIREHVLAEYTGKAEILTIPEGVLEIGTAAFIDNRTVAIIAVPEGVTKIGEYAFSGCTNLRTVTLPKTLKEIGKAAFRGAPIRRIELPEGMESLGEYAFHETKLETITIPGGIRTVPRGVFSACVNLMYATMKTGVFGIGAAAFAGCCNLKTLAVPNTLMSVCTDYAEPISAPFYGCENLDSIIASDVWKRAHASVFDAITDTATEAQYRKGLYFEAEKAYKESFSWYHRAACLGHVEAQGQVGLCYQEGKGVQKNEKMAFSWFKQAAENKKDYPLGKFYLGRCYETGIGITRDSAEAVRWYEIAAQQGNAYAQTKLGLCYQYGKGVKLNYKEAARLLSLAAEEDPIAKYHLGKLYLQGLGVPKDKDKAFACWQAGAAQGEPLSQLQLGVCYLLGLCGKAQPKAGFHWLTMAAEQGEKDAQKYVGDCYMSGNGVCQDQQKAAYWYERAAHKGQSAAMLQLGNCYQYGHGKPQDNQKAVYWYQQAADDGDIQAMLTLGDCYLNGNGVAQNKQKAMELFEKAYFREDPRGLQSLLLIYEKKNTLSKEDCEHIAGLVGTVLSAIKREDNSADQETVQALANTGYRFALEMMKYPGLKSTGLQWMKLCAKGGNIYARLWLGEAYRQGDDLPKDKEKAIYWYEQAAAQGNQTAKARLDSMKKGFWERLFS